ncbi:tolloid-like protein 1 isoform X2 [Mizuhopecten yessoensis]|uniref:tolloid-like protein 1 isoform X2 n=1 Tax=Mizuhopecten yessoensis TaxID=6573 RepID=UPI000B45A4FF|nr:tolloid-like protein 1 isoform X2 [Mizuhopecten yessoensis]
MRVLLWILTVYICRVQVTQNTLSSDDPLVLNFTEKGPPGKRLHGIEPLGFYVKKGKVDGAVDRPQDKAANCDHKFSFKMQQKGTFMSPGFPNKYPQEVECSYFFHATPEGRIKISFDYFNLEVRSDKGCQFDYIEIHYVNDEGFKSEVGRFCGTDTPEEFVSLQPKMEIVFKSDSTKEQNGFIAHYEFLGDNWQPFGPSTIGCGPGYLTGSGGLIISPNYPALFPTLSRCSWIIKVKDTQKILLQIVDMEISSSTHPFSSCTDAFLLFFNGFAIPGMYPEERFCDSLDNVPVVKREFLSTSSRVVIRFESGPSSSARKTGFKLVWTAVSLVKPGDCHGFMCSGNDKCSDRSSCRKYCIDQSLRCDGNPNCGEVDTSDEDKCLSRVLWITMYAVLPCILIIASIALIVYCYKRQRRKKLYIEKKEAQRNEQTHWVSPHIRSLEQSPNPGRSTTMLTTSFVSSKPFTDIDYKDNPVIKENVENSNKSDNLSNTVSSVENTPKKVVNNKKGPEIEENEIVVPSIDNKKGYNNEEPHVQFEMDTIPNFRTHQKRSSYHLMQELNLGESEIMIAKI